MIPEQTEMVMITSFSILVIKLLTKSRVIHVPATDNTVSVNKTAR